MGDRPRHERTRICQSRPPRAPARLSQTSQTSHATARVASLVNCQAAGGVRASALLWGDSRNNSQTPPPHTATIAAIVHHPSLSHTLSPSPAPCPQCVPQRERTRHRHATWLPIDRN